LADAAAAPSTLASVDALRAASAALRTEHRAAKTRALSADRALRV
jgi:hypothetical protein